MELEDLPDGQKCNSAFRDRVQMVKYIFLLQNEILGMKKVPTIAILRSTYLRYWNWLKKVHKSYHLDPNEERGLGLCRTLQFAVIFHEAYEMISVGQDQVFSATFAFHLSNYREKKIIIVKFWKIAEQDKTLIKFLCKITQLSLRSKNLSNFILERHFYPVSNYHTLYFYVH